MNKTTILQLNNLNKSFYQTTAKDFDDSRQYYWQGWETLLSTIHKNASTVTEPVEVLDIGCGNARFAEFLSENIEQEFKYTGIDSNKKLLEAATEKLSSETCNLEPENFEFLNLDIIEKLLDNKLQESLKGNYDLVVLFGVMHHIPSFNLRVRLIQTLFKKLTPKGLLVFTSWQFANHERFQNRFVSPSTVNIDNHELEENDYILDWRRGAKAYRYCHHLNEKEIESILKQLPAKTGAEQYYADGKSNDLNLYTVIQKN